MSEMYTGFSWVGVEGRSRGTSDGATFAYGAPYEVGWELHPRYRGSGVEEHIIDWLEESRQQPGCLAVALEDEHDAHPLLKSLGYEPNGNSTLHMWQSLEGETDPRDSGGLQRALAKRRGGGNQAIFTGPQCVP